MGHATSFSVTPLKAISSDLVAAVVMRPLGALLHFRKRTLNLRLVGPMSLGSVPMAFLGGWRSVRSSRRYSARSR